MSYCFSRNYAARSARLKIRRAGFCDVATFNLTLADIDGANLDSCRRMDDEPHRRHIGAIRFLGNSDAIVGADEIDIDNSACEILFVATGVLAIFA